MRGTVTRDRRDRHAAAPAPPPPLSAQPFLNDMPAPTIARGARHDRAEARSTSPSRACRAGARVRFRLSEAGKVTVKLTRSGRKAKTRTVTVRKGLSSVTVDGLRKGTYRVRISAADLAGNAARATKRVRVTVRS